MPKDSLNHTSVPVLFCRACEANLKLDGHRIDANGYGYCDKCVAELRRNHPHLVPLFKCDVCQRTWPLRGLTEKSDQLVCKECIATNRVGEPVTRPTFTTVPPVTQSPATDSDDAAMHSTTRRQSMPGVKVSRITCPHCWHIFSSNDLLWISQHADLTGDAVAGTEAALRFRPTRFNENGEALDSRDMPCQVLACPRCHLVVPRALTETSPLFISIVGAPACGKSYFLASMTWELRRVLAARFNIIFNDADPTFNQSLNRYEETLFLQDHMDRPVAIRKTEMQGELYDQVRLGEQIVTLPKPFLFTLRPGSKAKNPAWALRVMCLYDNAGEHYQPGMDTPSAPGTQHLARSQALFFLYDPCQHPRFREQCRTVSSDPQLHGAARSCRQEQILSEVASRVRKYARLPHGKKHERPLMVLVSKADIWGSLLGENLETEPLLTGAAGLRSWTVDAPRIERVSRLLRGLLLKHSPEFVVAAEDFCTKVIYIPISSLGHGPEAEKEGGLLAIRPDQIHPKWVTVPLLYLLGKSSGRLIPAAAAAAANSSGNPADRASTAPSHNIARAS